MAQHSYETYPPTAGALAAQQRALSDLADLVDRQGKMIAGLTIALGSLADFIGDNDLREGLEDHLRFALDLNAPDVADTIINVIFPSDGQPRRD